MISETPEIRARALKWMQNRLEGKPWELAAYCAIALKLVGADDNIPDWLLDLAEEHIEKTSAPNRGDSWDA